MLQATKNERQKLSQDGDVWQQQEISELGLPPLWQDASFRASSRIIQEHFSSAKR
jgi:hypothetical protein